MKLALFIDELITITGYQTKYILNIWIPQLSSKFVKEVPGSDRVYWHIRGGTFLLNFELNLLSTTKSWSILAIFVLKVIYFLW